LTGRPHGKEKRIEEGMHDITNGREGKRRGHGKGRAVDGG